MRGDKWEEERLITTEGRVDYLDWISTKETLL